MMPKSTPESRRPDVQTLSYEQAYAELEEIVYGLETNQKSLDEALTLFERGQALAQYCASLLDQAELRVRQLSDLPVSNSSAEMEEGAETDF